MSYPDTGRPTPEKHIQPFVQQVKYVFKYMFLWEVDSEEPVYKDNWAPESFVSGMITLRGGIQGTIALGFSPPMACQLTSYLLERRIHQINDDVSDAVRELTNTIVGRATPRLPNMSVRLSLPSVMIGRSRPIDYPRGMNPTLVTFFSSHGQFTLEVALREVSTWGMESDSSLLTPPGTSRGSSVVF